jgi:hypothetical protein
VIVSLFVSSHPSRARLHVNARTRPLRQTLRQTRSVAQRRDDQSAQASANFDEQRPPREAMEAHR